MLVIWLLTMLLSSSCEARRSVSRHHSESSRHRSRTFSRLESDSVANYPSFATKISSPCRVQSRNVFKRSVRDSNLKKRDSNLKLKNILDIVKVLSPKGQSASFWSLFQRLFHSNKEIESSDRNRRETTTTELNQKIHELQNLIFSIKSIIRDHTSAVNYDCGDFKPRSLSSYPSNVGIRNQSLEEVSTAFLRYTKSIKAFIICA